MICIIATADLRNTQTDFFFFFFWRGTFEYELGLGKRY